MLYVSNDPCIDYPTIFFDNDDEFYKFCVIPELIPHEYTRDDSTTGYYVDFEFSNAYNDAIKNGYHFVIKDEDSQICKHNAVSYRFCTKQLQNLDRYYPTPYKIKIHPAKNLSDIINNEDNK